MQQPSLDKRLCSVLFLYALAMQPGIAAENAPHACTAIKSDAERLACYDQAFGSPPSTSSPVAASDATAPDEKVSLDSAIPHFGLTQAQIDERESSSGPTQITAAVAQLSKRPTGEFIVTLENQQVWLQREVSSRVRLKTGDAVSIRQGALGSYLLTTPDGVVTRVRRIE